MNQTSVEIGTLVLGEPRDYINHFETAAWFEQIRVEPGRYPVTANLDSPTGTSGKRVYWVHAALPGTIIDASLRSLCCGVPISSTNPGEDRIGQSGSARLSGIYGYLIAQALEEARPIMGGTLELNEGWTVDNGDIVRA